MQKKVLDGVVDREVEKGEPLFQNLLFSKRSLVETLSLAFSLPTTLNPFKLFIPFDSLSSLDSGVCTYIHVAELEEGTPIINWSSELVDEMGCYLYPLWNRTAGDCLLDSVLQATWGVMDRDGTLRRALADSLVDGASL